VNHLISSDKDLTFVDSDEVSSDLLWRVSINADGSAKVEMPAKGLLGCAAAFTGVAALRAVAAKIEAAALEAEAVLYGKGGEA
jgi:hypothetical protein